MECPWPNLASDCDGDISSDLTKLRISAAMAFKRIESSYEEIMGCNRFTDEFLEGLSDSPRHESDSPSVDFVKKPCHRRKESPKVSRKQKQSTDRSRKTCSWCRRQFVDEQRSFRQFGDKQRPSRQFVEEQRPYHQFVDEQRPYRQFVDEQRPYRQFVSEQKSYRRFADEQRPYRQFTDEHRQCAGEQRPHRQFADEQRPFQRFVDEQKTFQQFSYFPLNIEVSYSPPKTSCNCCNKASNMPTESKRKDSVIEHPHEAPNKAQSKKGDQTKPSSCPVKVTVPEPFQMTLRDENQKVMKELKIEQLRKKLNDEKEKQMQTTFYSNSVPGHVYLPIYQKMIHSEQKRKQERKKTAKEVKESCKNGIPNYTHRSRFRSGSIPDLSKPDDHKFKANPVPKHILNHKIDEKLKTKEVVRKLRIAQRAQETLQESSVPFTSRSLRRTSSMTSLSEKSEPVKPKPCTKSFIQAESKEVMRQWNIQVYQKVSAQNTETLSSDNSEKHGYQKRYDEFLSLKSAPLSDVPIRMTSASMMREREIRQKLKHKISTEINVCCNARKPNTKELREQLLLQLKLNDLAKGSKEELEEKLQSYRASRKHRQQEYEKELSEMRDRVSKKPLLIERLGQGKKAESTKNHVSNANSDASQKSSSEEIAVSLNNSDDEGSHHTESQKTAASDDDDSHHTEPQKTAASDDDSHHTKSQKTASDEASNQSSEHEMSS